MHYSNSRSSSSGGGGSSCSAEVAGMLRYKSECVGARCKQKSLASISRSAGQWRGVHNNFPVEFPCSVIRM